MRNRVVSRIETWFRSEIRALMRPVLWSMLAVLIVVGCLTAQLARPIAIDVGYEEGIGSDLPFLQGFNTAEQDANGTFRWTSADSQVIIPGFGRRTAVVYLHFFPFGPEVAAAGPDTINVHVGEQLLTSLPIRAEGSVHRVVLPASPDGTLRISLRSETFSLPNDERALGTLLDYVRIVPLSGGFALPDSRTLGVWLLVIVIGWLSIRHALEGSSRIAQHNSTISLVIAAGLVAIAALIEPTRWAFGSNAALIAAGLAYPLTLGIRWMLPKVAAWMDVPLDRSILGWLTLFIVLSFALRYGGRLYPNSMHGDIGFHQNRFNEAIWGLIHILSTNRGVDFPYPPAAYFSIAPLTLLGIHPRTALEFGAAMVDALSAWFIYAIATRLLAARTALLAAAIYVFTAATFMVTWWSFDTHIYTQFFHLLAISGLIWAWEAWQRPAPRQQFGWIIAVAALLGLVFLGHFGFLINTALLVGGITVAVWIASWRGVSWARRVRMPLTLAVGLAGGFAGVTFYSAYIPLFLSQIQTAGEGGLTAVAGRGPVSRAVMWETLWRVGLVTHFGLFPLPLALWGCWHLARTRGERTQMDARRAIVWMMGGSLLIAVVFAALPFVTGLTNSPRWMLFIAWIVAIGAAAAVERIWQYRTIGRPAVVVMGALVLLNSAWIWLSPMLWRIRPPEPF